MVKFKFITIILATKLIVLVIHIRGVRGSSNAVIKLLPLVLSNLITTTPNSAYMYITKPTHTIAFNTTFMNLEVMVHISFHISACNCNTLGSNSNNCNDNGVCICRANIVGSKCNSCIDGLFNFPLCDTGKHYAQLKVHF